MNWRDPLAVMRFSPPVDVLEEDSGGRIRLYRLREWRERSARWWTWSRIPEPRFRYETLRRRA